MVCPEGLAETVAGAGTAPRQARATTRASEPRAATRDDHVPPRRAPRPSPPSHSTALNARLCAPSRRFSGSTSPGSQYLHVPTRTGTAPGWRTRPAARERALLRFPDHPGEAGDHRRTLGMPLSGERLLHGGLGKPGEFAPGAIMKTLGVQ